MRGKITSNWYKKGKKLFFDLQIPANTEAVIYLPIYNEGSIYESGQEVDKVYGVTLVRMEKNDMVYRVESGRYKFEIR